MIILSIPVLKISEYEVIETSQGLIFWHINTQTNKVFSFIISVILSLTRGNRSDEFLKYLQYFANIIKTISLEFFILKSSHYIYINKHQLCETTFQKCF